MAVVTSLDQLAIQLLHPAARPPARTRAGDAAYDLACVEAFTLAAGERAMIPTGVAVAIPPGMAGLVLPRSGLAIKHGISCVNAPGLVDPNYRGELRVILINHGAEPFSAVGGRSHRPAAAGARSWRPSWSSSTSCPTAATTAARAASAPRALGGRPLTA